MPIDLILAPLIIAFLLIAALGHVLLTAAIYKCLREDYVDGRAKGQARATRKLPATTGSALAAPATSLKRLRPQRAEAGADPLYAASRWASRVSIAR